MTTRIYKFKSDDAEAFARSMNVKYRHRGDQLELMFCPYCKSATDKWTFGINTKTGQFECKRSSCSAKGNMITLSRDFSFSLGRDVDAYYQTADYSGKQFRKFKDAHKPVVSKPYAVEYLVGRGIAEDVVKKYEITTKADDDKTLAFPFRDSDGDIVYIKYRNTEYVKGESKGSKEYCEAECKPILFGINHCDPSEGELIITEGQIDSLSVVTAGYRNAVSVPNGCNGFTWIPYCWDFMNKFDSIVVMGDCENGKITLAEELSKRWPKKVKVCRQEDYLGCKDANDVLRAYGRDQIHVMVRSAQPQYSAHIKPLAKVKDVDIMAIQSIHTRMDSLDGILDGGFRLGQLAVLTGRRGEGKSTIASQWGVQAIEQGFNCFFYSGELMDFYFKNWMDCQVTGKGTHTQSENDKLAVWYGDKAYIYDDTMVEGEEMEGLLETVETAIIQNGCKFVLLDNLMTAIDADPNTDIYRSQSKFVGDLAALAKRHGVFILLIAHPRKTYNGNLSNDDISGSSNITDRADIVMSFGKDKDDAEMRCLTVIKNRLTGKCTKEDNPIKLNYDKTGSRRLAENFSDFRSMHFSWNGDPYGWEDVPDEIPF